jgi:hypothetical protein
VVAIWVFKRTVLLILGFFESFRMIERERQVLRAVKEKAAWLLSQGLRSGKDVGDVYKGGGRGSAEEEVNLPEAGVKPV